MGVKLDHKRMGEKLKAARESEHLTQVELGDLVGLSQSMVGKVERGKATLTLENLFSLSEVLKRPVSYFLGIEVGSLSDDEVELLETYRCLENGLPRQYAIKIMRTLAE